MCLCAHSQLYLTFHSPMDHSLPSSSVHSILQTEILSELPFPPPGNLPNLGLKPMSPESPELVGRFFTTEPREKPAYRTAIIKRSLCKWLSRYMLENTCLCKQKKIKQSSLPPSGICLNLFQKSLMKRCFIYSGPTQILLY